MKFLFRLFHCFREEEVTHQVVFLGRLWFLFVIFIQFSKLKEKWDCKTLVGHRRPRCSVCWPFPGRQKGKWGNVVFVQIPTAEVYFPTQRCISRPQGCIFKLCPLSFPTPGWRQELITDGFIARKAGKGRQKMGEWEISRKGAESHWFNLFRSSNIIVPLGGRQHTGVLSLGSDKECLPWGPRRVHTVKRC